ASGNDGFDRRGYPESNSPPLERDLLRYLMEQVFAFGVAPGEECLLRRLRQASHLARARQLIPQTVSRERSKLRFEFLLPLGDVGALAQEFLVGNQSAEADLQEGFGLLVAVTNRRLERTAL